MLSFLEQYSYVKFFVVSIVMLSFVQMQQIPTLSSVPMLHVRYVRVQYAVYAIRVQFHRHSNAVYVA